MFCLFIGTAQAQGSFDSRTNSAENSADRLMQAIQNSNGHAAAAQMQGRIKEKYLSTLKTMSMREMQEKSDGRILNYERRCRVCNPQATKCGIVFDTVTDKSYRGQSIPVLVVLEPNSSGFMKATEFYEPDQSTLDWYGRAYQGCRR